MRLVLPLDVCNAALYIFFMVVLAILRIVRNAVAPEIFYAVLEWITLVNAGAGRMLTRFVALACIGSTANLDLHSHALLSNSEANAEYRGSR